MKDKGAVMTRLRIQIRAVAVAFIASFATTSAVHAIDASGAWDVSWSPPGVQAVCILTQVGTALTIDCEQVFAGPPAPLGPFTVTGTIDPGTGVFSYVGPSDPETGC